MVSASFQQTSFLGGEWSRAAQGRMTDPNYKRSLAASYNSMPTETGAHTRRPGFRFLGITRHGAPAKLFQFDFSTVQPYQIVMTADYLRMFAGLAPVIADDEDGYPVLDVSTATPAIVTSMPGLPATWVTGDTVQFAINTDPCSCPALCNRDFTIKSVDVDAGTFALYDPITDAAIDGSTLAWSAPEDGVFSDTVKKVFEIATPYTDTEWQDVRVTNNGTEVTFWHPSHKPKSLALGSVSGIPFTLADQEFIDGPYLDLNDTSTTLTPSGTTGSITMVASAVTGINGGDGFKTTDVGRHIRFQSAPAEWDSGTAYAKAAQVTGSDLNVYAAVVASTGIDPTTDNATHWIIAATPATWVWMKVTAWNSATSVTCLVEGETDISQESPIKLGNTLSSVNPSKVWQIGAFSDTTGWPSMACYHDGRLWLANQITANRYDASCSNDFFNFCPTASDGTISDANGFTDVIQTEEVDAVYWMLSTGDGLMIGTQGSEHRIKASVLDDPLSFVNQQERRVSKFGSRNAEALYAWGRPVFVQRQGRKLISMRQVKEALYDGDNLTMLAEQISTRGIEEVRWQQEPALTLWCRLSDGGLAGCVYRSSEYRFGYEMADLNYEAFFPVYHAYERSFVSLSTGPNFDGTSNALYAITNQTDSDAPGYNVHHVEYLMPMFNDAVEDWGAFFVDGGASPCCGREFLVSNGDAFNGVRLYGLTYLNGLTTSVVIGGLDIGDYTVANGYVDVVFGTPAEFTQAFFEALSDGTDYGIFEADVSFVSSDPGTSVYPIDNIGMYDDEAQTQYDHTIVDPKAGLVHKLGETDGLVSYNDATFDVVTTKTVADLNLTPWEIATDGVTIFNGWIIGNSTLSNHSQKFRVKIADGTRVTYGIGSTHTTPSGSEVDDDYAMRTSFQIVPLSIGSQWFTAHVDGTNEICVMDADNFVLIRGSVTNADEDLASICAGPYGDGFASIFVTAGFALFGPSDGIGLYWGFTNGAGLGLTKLALLAPTDIDATWTTFAEVSSPFYVAKNNTFVFFVYTNDSVTNKSYLVCYDPVAKAIKWQHGFTFSAGLQPTIYGTVKTDYIVFALGNSNPTFYKFAIADGTSTTMTFQGNIVGYWGFNPADGSMVSLDLLVNWGTDPTFLGTFAIAHGHTPPRSVPAKAFFDLPVPGDPVTYSVPTSTGLTYESKGQLLPPNFGVDAGARNGPAFGKKRRLHWYAALVNRTRGLLFGANLLGTMRPMSLASEGGTIPAAPSLLSDTVTTMIDDTYSFKGQIAWKITRPYPATITAIGGYIETMDK